MGDGNCPKFQSGLHRHVIPCLMEGL